MSVSALEKLSKRFAKSFFWSADLLSGFTLKSASNNKLTNFKRRLSSTKEIKPVLRLLTKENCMLCEEAKHILFSAPERYNERLVLQEVDIRAEGNEDLFDLYRYEIPVFFLGRIFISKNHIDLDKLKKELIKIELGNHGTKQDE